MASRWTPGALSHDFGGRGTHRPPHTDPLGDDRAALAEAQRRAAGIRGAVSGDRLAESLADLARGCELAATRPDLRRRVARGLIARAVWRPGVVAADLTIDVPSRVQVDGSACRPGLPVRLWAVTIGTDEYRRRAA